MLHRANPVHHRGRGLRRPSASCQAEWRRWRAPPPSPAASPPPGEASRASQGGAECRGTGVHLKGLGTSKLWARSERTPSKALPLPCVLPPPSWLRHRLCLPGPQGDVFAGLGGARRAAGSNCTRLSAASPVRCSRWRCPEGERRAARLINSTGGSASRSVPASGLLSFDRLVRWCHRRGGALERRAHAGQRDQRQQPAGLWWR